MNRRQQHHIKFYLTGKVQVVKMRRYIEAAARHCGVEGGFCINTNDGHVYGEAVHTQVTTQQPQTQLATEREGGK